MLIEDPQQLSMYLPHRGPIICVSGLVSCDEKRTVGFFKIPESHFFIENGFFSSEGLIEALAQTIALRVSWLNPEVSPAPGVIGDIKNFNLFHLPAGGTTIYLSLLLMHEVPPAQILHGQIFEREKEKGEKIAECDLKVFSISFK